MFGFLTTWAERNHAIIDLIMSLAMISVLIYFGLVLQPQIIYKCNFDMNFTYLNQTVFNATP